MSEKTQCQLMDREVEQELLWGDDVEQAVELLERGHHTIIYARWHLIEAFPHFLLGIHKLLFLHKHYTIQFMLT